MNGPRRVAPTGFGRLLSNLARQLDLPLFGAGATPPTPRPRTRTPREPRRPGAPDVATRSVRLGDRELSYTLRRARRKTIGFTIASTGLTVAAPRWVGVRQIDDAVRARERWIVTKLDELRRQPPVPQVRWKDGGTFPFRGTPVTLHVVAAPTWRRASAPRFDAVAGTLTVTGAADADALRDRVVAWLRGEARALFVERLAHYEAVLGRRHRALRLSSARTRWGSCSADGRILLNWRLVHFPLAAVDYVVAHELSHLREMNHGPRFWATVASILPDYETGRALVRTPPPALLPTL